MSDYGFATYDDKTGKIAEKISYKYPIFGPEYRNIATQYKTIHINDTKVNSVRSASLTVPNMIYQYSYTGTAYDIYYGDSYYVSNYDELVYRYEHGFKKRPMGYAIITGNLVRNTRTKLVQTVVAGSNVGGNFTVTPIFTSSVGLAPDRNGLKELGVVDIPMWNSNILTVKRLSDGGVTGKDIIIPNACMGIFGDYPNLTDVKGSNTKAPYRVEIDDTYVKIYRNISWADHLVRAGYQNATLDVRERTQAIEDYAGSSLDVTLYLVPYSLEDLG